MNSNLFERKSFIDGNWIMTDKADLFKIEESGNSFVIKVNLLRATANEADHLRKFLDGLKSNKNHSIVIFDLTSCNFVDSTFLSGIISFKNKSSFEIKLVVSDPRQIAIFKISKIDALFKIYTSLPNAINS